MVFSGYRAYGSRNRPFSSIMTAVFVLYLREKAYIIPTLSTDGVKAIHPLYIKPLMG
jgi:hypothetical protein